MKTKIVLIFFIFASLIAVLVILRFFPLLPAVNYPVSAVSGAIGRFLYQGASRVSETASFVFNSREKIKEAEDLRKEVRALSAQVAELQDLKKENDILRKQLNFFENNPYSFLITNIIGRTDEEGRKILILDKGESQGVRSGMPVIIDNGLLVGKIIKTEKNKSFLLASVSNQSKIAATFSSHSETLGIIRGEYSLSLKMEMVPKDVNIQAGNIAITSGLESLIPRGLLIGKVEQVSNLPGELFQTVYLTSLYSVSELRIAAIILGAE